MIAVDPVKDCEGFFVASPAVGSSIGRRALLRGLETGLLTIPFLFFCLFNVAVETCLEKTDPTNLVMHWSTAVDVVGCGLLETDPLGCRKESALRPARPGPAVRPIPLFHLRVSPRQFFRPLGIIALFFYFHRSSRLDPDPDKNVPPRKDRAITGLA